jgi:hypothetical protein
MILEIVLHSAKRNAKPEAKRNRGECKQDSRRQRAQSLSCKVAHDF